jgi:hypothetical protein
MTSSFIPQRIKPATQQITVELYKDQLAMLDNHGRFIDDSPDYIISQALELVFRRDKEFTRWIDQEKSSCSNVETLTHSLDHNGMREKSVLAQKS